MPTPTKCKVVVTVFVSVVFVVGVVVWSSIYFIIYYPLLHRTWTRANCTITESRPFTTSYATYQALVVYAAIVEEGNRTLPGLGYGCASNLFDSAITYEGGDGYYPYQYRDCSSMLVVNGECKEDEEIQPNWLCLDYTKVEQYQVGNRVECKYYINGNEHADDYLYPQPGADFIEVLYQDEVYIPMGDYIALWVCVFGLLCVVPCLASPYIIGIWLGWWSRVEQQKFRDFYHRFLRCRRARKPGCIEAVGLESKIPPAPIIVWLYTVKNCPHLFPLKTAFIREIGDYLS